MDYEELWLDVAHPVGFMPNICKWEDLGLTPLHYGGCVWWRATR